MRSAGERSAPERLPAWDRRRRKAGLVSGKGRTKRPLKARGLAEFDRIRRRLGVAILALLTVMIVGIVGFAWIGAGEHDIVDAVYMTVITLTTVGYGEVIDMSDNPGARLFTIVLLMIGMGIVAYSLPAVTAFFIEGELLRGTADALGCPMPPLLPGQPIT